MTAMIASTGPEIPPSAAPSPEYAGARFHGYTEFLHTGCQLHKALHGYTDFGDQGADDDEQRPQRSNDQADGQDCFPLAFAHAVQLVHECLNLTDNSPDGRHQHLAEGYGQFLKLRFEDGQLPGQIVLHGLCHLRGSAVTVVDGGAEFFYILRSGIHQGEEAGHGVLADQRFRGLRSFRFRKLRKGPTAVRQNI